LTVWYLTTTAMRAILKCLNASRFLGRPQRYSRNSFYRHHQTKILLSPCIFLSQDQNLLPPDLDLMKHTRGCEHAQNAALLLLYTSCLRHYQKKIPDQSTVLSLSGSFVLLDIRMFSVKNLRILSTVCGIDSCYRPIYICALGLFFLSLFRNSTSMSYDILPDIFIYSASVSNNF